MPEAPSAPALSRILSASYVVVRAVGQRQLLFVSLDDCTLRAIDLDTQLVRTLQQHESPAWALDVHGDLLASGGTDRHADIIVWSISDDFSPTNMLQGHTDTVRALQFSADGQILASCSKDGTVRIWTAEEGVFSCTHILDDHQAPVYVIDWAGASLLSAGGDGLARLWSDDQQFAHADTLNGDKGQAIRHGAVGGQASRTIAISDTGAALVRVWVGNDGPTELDGLEGLVNRVQFHGETLVASDNSGNVMAWDTNLQRQYKIKAHSDSVTAWTAVAGASSFATGGANSPVKVWELQTGKLLWESPKQYDVVWALYSPDEHRIAVLAHEGDRAKVELWKLVK